MKKLFLMAIGLMSVISASAQLEDALPLDPNVKYGKLDNGLTYYIRHNEWPEQRADFYIAQKVGSMQEEDNQRGLAHFLEHMCFNGTTHFPGNQLKTYLETIGVKFGENLNAYTSFDETVYNINNVKTTSVGSLDSCLLILHDWSHDLLLEGDEIDKERGVINEEWRMRRSAMQRMYEGALPDIYPGSKYANRMPIGTMDIVMNFPYDDLRSYYRKWYRPDLQAVIVVGDVDVDRTEAKIKELFADIQAPPADAAVREYYPVPDTPEPLVSIQTDKEQTHNIMLLMMKHESMPREQKGGALKLIDDYFNSAVSSMFDSRIAEILQKPNPPFIQAGMSDEEYFVAKTKDAVTGQVVFQDNGQDEALATLYREMLRVTRFGFTESEFDRFKQEYLSRLEDRYAKKDKVENTVYVNQCVRHFLDGDAMPGIETEYKVMKMLVPSLPVSMINEAIKESVTENDSNLVIVMLAPEKDGVTMPTKQHLVDILKKVQAENIEAYAEEVNTDPLISEDLKGSKVKSVKDGIYDSKVITLDNGIVIHVKKTDYTPNSISMRAVSWGGTAYYSNDEYRNAAGIDDLSIGGYGNFSATELKKRLAGIQANASPTIDHRTEGMRGRCVVKDFETMLQLTYLAFTSPRRDNDAFKSYIDRTKQSLSNQDLAPTTALQDTIASVVYNNNIRARRMKAADVEQLNYDRMLQMYNERFADGDDFEFYFVGDIDIDQATPLFEKYLGSLPVLKGSEKMKVIDQRIAKGKRTNVFEKELQTPMAIVVFLYHAPMKDTPRNEMLMSMLEQLMTMHYTESVREDEGGAYGVPVQGGVTDYPEEIAEFIVQLPTAPEKRARMTELVYAGIDKICADGPKAEDLQKVKEYMHRKHAEDLKENTYWMSSLIRQTRFNYDEVTNYDTMVDQITAKEIQDFAKKILKSGNLIEVGMTSPEKK